MRGVHVFDILGGSACMSSDQQARMGVSKSSLSCEGEATLSVSVCSTGISLCISRWSVSPLRLSGIDKLVDHYDSGLRVVLNIFPALSVWGWFWIEWILLAKEVSVRSPGVVMFFG